MDEAFIKKIWAVYNTTGSLRKTADEMGFAYAKIRKALITYGAYSTPFSDEVFMLRNKGYSIEEIAKELGTTAKRVTAWLPYEKTVYSVEEKSKDAIRSDVYRKRINQARENSVFKKLNDNELELNGMEKTNAPRNEASSGIKNETTHLGNPFRLHLKLQNEWADEESQRILKKYGRSSTGNTIERDILIPADMTLHALHYAIQKLFGWQNSHLRSFKLPDDIYDKLTNKTVKGWGNLIGVLFQTTYPEKAEFARYADDDYDGGSIRTWLKKKFTGPYDFLNTYEQYDVAVDEFYKFINHFSNMAVYEPLRLNNGNKSNAERIIKHAPVIDLTLDELNASIFMEEGTKDLLERLTVASVLAPVGIPTAKFSDLNQRMVSRLYNNGFDEIEEPEVIPVTYKLLYHYDYGDGWCIEITMPNDCNDLLGYGYITEQELIEAQNTVIEKYKPVCIHQDGMCVVDDVGGFSGFIDLLQTLYESDDPEEKENMRTWSSGMGWNTRKVANKNML